jgi:VanZ family protein
LSSSVRIFRFWLPALLWLVVIAFESLFLSSDVTGGLLWKITRFLHVPLSWGTFERFHHLLRKAGHVTGYGILCLFVFRGWYRSKLELSASSRRENAVKPARKYGIGLAIGVTLITAILDELHQSFDPSRTASVRDVGLDVAGGIIFLAIALFILKRWRDLPAREPETVSA